MTPEAQWSVTMLFIHTAAAVGFVMLFREAPCWMQRVIVGLLTLSMTFLAAGDLVTLILKWDHWLTRIGMGFMHAGVLLYVFRLHFQRPKWATSSANFPQ